MAALLPARQNTHPLGCHRPRIPDRIVFDKLIQVLVFGCGYRRIAAASCSATTLRRRRDEWIALGLAEQLRLLVLGAYDRLLGLELEHLVVDGCITYQPCRQVLAVRGTVGQIAAPGVPAPIQAGRRWVIERTHAWGNQYGKLRWYSERRRTVVEFWLALVSAVILAGTGQRRHRVWPAPPPRLDPLPLAASPLVAAHDPTGAGLAVRP